MRIWIQMGKTAWGQRARKQPDPEAVGVAVGVAYLPLCARRGPIAEAEYKHDRGRPGRVSRLLQHPAPTHGSTVEAS